MEDAAIRSILRRLDRLERDYAVPRRGLATDEKPLDVSLGGATDVYEGVAALAGTPARTDHPLAALRWQGDLLALGRIGAIPSAKQFYNGSRSVTSTPTAVPFSTTPGGHWDNDGMFDGGANTRLTVQTPGLWLAWTYLPWPNVNGQRLGQIRKDGATVGAHRSVWSGSAEQTIAALVAMDAGSYFELFVYSSPDTTVTDPGLTVVWLAEYPL